LSFLFHTMPLFKGKKEPTPQEALQVMKDTLDMVEKREEFLQKKSNRQVEEAKKSLHEKNKKGALICMKRKKHYDQEIEKLANTKVNLETQIMAIEGATVSKEAMLAMQKGAEAMKAITNSMKIDDVENFMDDINEQYELANQLSSLIATPIGEPIDDDELLTELDELVAEEELEKEVEREVSRKAVPAKESKIRIEEEPEIIKTKQPTKKRQTEDDELETWAKTLA